MKEIKHNRTFIGSLSRIIAVVATILLALYVTTIFLDEMNWGLADFVVIGILLFGAGLVYELITHRLKDRKQRIITAAVIILAVAYIWAELGVGIFTNLGS